MKLMMDIFYFSPLRIYYRYTIFRFLLLVQRLVGLAWWLAAYQKAKKIPYYSCAGKLCQVASSRSFIFIIYDLFYFACDALFFCMRYWRSNRRKRRRYCTTFLLGRWNI
ncbi:hypothetical protein B0H66DRAFT_360582 [Apodospora peruviana]|uniref:Uncharacterized protein n=1 Tax=Apodospora peruviana TaxID=516989 RepID=A0AAE0HVN8_9PEZI|nr:hypothetical protein B0H66DRAFT_360582 [Apodospora peruviana]